MSEGNLRHLANPNSDQILIFIPGGLGLGFDYFPEYFDALKKKRGLVFYNPGTQLSSELKDFSQLSEELKHIVDRFPGKRIRFISHSKGTFILLNYFKRYGSQPSVIISGVVDNRWMNHFKKQNERVQELMTSFAEGVKAFSSEEDRFRFRLTHYLEFYFPPATREVGGRLFKSLKLFPQVLKFAENHDPGDSYLEALRSAKDSILFLYGTKDQVVFPSYVEEVCEGTSIQCVPINGAGHFPFVENPDKVCELVERFLESLEN